MQRYIAEVLDEVLMRWTVRRAQLRRRTLWPDPVLLEDLRAGRTTAPLLDDPGAPSDVDLIAVGEGPTGPDYRFRFDSSPPFGQEHDRSVYGALFVPRGEIRAGVVLLPGAFTGVNKATERGFYHKFAAGFARQGIAAALLQVPLHQERTPSGEISGHNFFHGDIFTHVRAMAQAVRDVRSTIGWMERGYGATGYWGISLGALVGSMVVSRDARLAFAVLVQPPIRRASALGSPLTRVWMAQLAESGLSDEDVQRALEPLRSGRPPACGPERVLLQGSRWDRLAAPEGVRDLWRRWGEPRLLWYDHSHTSMFLARDRLIADALEFAEHRLTARARGEEAS